MTAQFLWSDSETPNRPDLAAEWDGRGLTGSAADLRWQHITRAPEWFVHYRELGEVFRADAGFVPQVGLRLGEAFGGWNFYPTGLLNRARPQFLYTYSEDRDGNLIDRNASPGVLVQGRRNLIGEVDLNLGATRLGEKCLLPDQRLLPFPDRPVPPLLAVRGGRQRRPGIRLRERTGRRRPAPLDDLHGQADRSPRARVHRQPPDPGRRRGRGAERPALPGADRPAQGDLYVHGPRAPSADRPVGRDAARPRPLPFRGFRQGGGASTGRRSSPTSSTGRRCCSSATETPGRCRATAI